MKEPLLTQPALPRDLAGRPSTAAWEFPAYEGSSLNMRVERIVGSSLNMRVDRITLEHLLSVRTTARVSDLTVLESSLPSTTCTRHFTIYNRFLLVTVQYLEILLKQASLNKAALTRRSRLEHVVFGSLRRTWAGRVPAYLLS